MRWFVRFLVAVIAFAGVLLQGGSAAAHTDLISSEPANGATVERLERVVLRFSTRVETAGSHVWIEQGSRVLPLTNVARLEGDEHTLVATIPALDAGAYRVGWHVLGADAHAITGALDLSLSPPVPSGRPAAAEPAPVADPAPAPVAAEVHGHGDGLATGAARVLLDASLATLLGGLAFVAAVWPQGASLASTRRLLWSAALVAGVASFALAALQHATAGGLSVAEALAPAHLATSLQFQFGRVALARLALLATAALLLSSLSRGGARTARSLPWCAATLAVAVGLFETIVLMGHSGGGGLGTAARLAHTAGVSLWLGGLAMLFIVVLPRRQPRELAAVLPRFSVLATLAVGVLLPAGTLLSIDLVGATGSLPTTEYGRVLVVKVVAVTGLLVVAARSRRHVRARLASPRSPAGSIATWVGVELSLMTVVLGLTALLVIQAPPG